MLLGRYARLGVLVKMSLCTLEQRRGVSLQPCSMQAGWVCGLAIPGLRRTEARNTTRVNQIVGSMAATWALDPASSASRTSGKLAAQNRSSSEAALADRPRLTFCHYSSLRSDSRKQLISQFQCHGSPLRNVAFLPSNVVGGSAAGQVRCDLPSTPRPQKGGRGGGDGSW